MYNHSKPIKKIRNLFDNKILVRFLVTYMIIVLLTIPCMMYIAGRFISVTQKHSLDVASEQVQKTADTFNQKLEELYNMSYTLAQSPVLLPVTQLSSELENADYIKILSLVNNIERYYNYSECTDGIHFWLNKGKLALIDKMVLTPQHDFYTQQVKFDGISYDEFYTNFYESGQMEQLCQVHYTNQAISKEIYLYCVNLDVFSQYKTQTCVFFIINESYLEELFSSYWQQYNGSILITANDGKVLFSTGENDHLIQPQAENYYSDGYLCLFAEKDLFTYQVFAEEKSIREESLRLRLQLVVLISGILLLGISLSFYFSYHYAQPLQTVVNYLRKYRPATAAANKAGDVHEISKSVIALVNNQKQLQFALDQERQLRRQRFFSNLLSAQSAVSQQIIDEECQSFNIPTSYAFYTVVYLSVSLPPTGYHPVQTDDDTLFRDTLISHTLTSSLPDLLDIQSPQQNAFWVVTGLNSISRDELVLQLENLIQLLQEEYRIYLSSSIGVPVQKLGMIFEPYNAAKHLLEYMPVEQKQAVYLVEQNDCIENWEYTAAVETTLIRCCVAGDRTRTLEIIDQIFTGIQDQSTINLNQMIYSFRGTILRILTAISGESFGTAASASRHITSCQNMEELKQTLTEIFSSICLLVQNEEKMQQDSFYQSIIRYIHENYQDPNLGLTSTADHFHINEKYLSHFFKEKGGINFSSVVEKVRMNEVIRYMTETDLPISEICICCGYSSSNSFYKAFRRIYGVSPNTYRKHLK